MTTNTTSHPFLHALARPLLAASGAAFLIATIILALGFAEYPDGGVAGVDFSPAADAQSADLITGAWIALVGALLLLLAIAGLNNHQAVGGRWMPGYATTLGLIGAASGAITFFLAAVYEPYFAGLAPETYDEAYGNYPLSFALPYFGTLVLFALGLAALGVGGRRARLLPRSASVLLVLGALAIPTVGPVVIGLPGIGLMLAARRPAPAKADPTQGDAYLGATPLATGVATDVKSPK